MAQLNFDATQVQPDEGTPTPIPAGVYNVMVDESDVKPTKDGSGAYLAVRYNIIDGQYAGRKIFDRFNIKNANPVAQEIGFKQLSALAHAVGVLHVQDSAQLHAIPLQVKVKIRAASGDYEASNEVSGRYAANSQSTGGAAPAANGNSPFPTQQAPAQQAPAQPWGQPAAQQAPVQQQAPAQPWGQPAAQQAPVQQQAPAQPWGQPAAQQAPVQQQDPQGQLSWATGVAEQAPQGQAVQQQAPQGQAPIVGQPANVTIPQGQTAQTATPPWAQPA